MLILWKFRSVADHDKAAKGLRQRCGQRPEEGRIQVITHKGQVIIIYAGAGSGLVSVPVHAGEVLDIKTLKSILEQANLTVEELIDLL